MWVKLHSHSMPFVENKELSDFSPEDLVSHMARVSNPSNQLNKQTGEKLIRFLIKNRHWSPLEMVTAVLEIETTRDIGRQVLRHHSFRFQEFSQRYSNPLEELEFVIRECRLQDEKNRQNSIAIMYDSSLMDDEEKLNLITEWERRQRKVISLAKETYKWAIENNIAKEQARVVLPEGLTKTRMYMKGDLRSWLHYIDLRTKNGTQKEHMDLAKACSVEIAKVFPNIINMIESEN